MKKISQMMILFCLGILLSSAADAALKSERVKSNAEPSAVLTYFYSDGCPECRHVKEEILPPLQKKYASIIDFDFREMSGIENLRFLLSLEKKAGREIKKSPPLIFFADEIFEGKSSIEKRLPAVLEQFSASRPESLRNKNSMPSAGDNADVVKRFKGLGVAAVVAGGLIDGINPCAFATLIFFLSYLSLTGKKGKELVIAGAGYSFGVFAAYLLIGIGLFEIVRRVEAFAFVSKIISWSIGGFAIAVSILSLYDYFRIRKGGGKKAVLQLGSFLKKRIHAAVRTKTRAGLGIASGIALGGMVGLLEFPCTGQVYFPIVVVIRGIGEYRMQAFGYLLLYNFIFILPLLAVFAFAYYGVSSDRFADIMNRRLPAIKLLSALMFAALGLLIFLI